MSSSAKFQNNLFVRQIVSRKNVRRTFLSSEQLHDFSKILFYGDIVNNGTCLLSLMIFGQVVYEQLQSQRNCRSGCIRALLPLLNDSIISSELQTNFLSQYIILSVFLFCLNCRSKKVSFHPAI